MSKANRVQRLVDYVENNPILKKLKVDTYLSIEFDGDNTYERFLHLFHSMRVRYIEEYKNIGAGDVLQLSKDEMIDFCKFFVSEFNELNIKLKETIKKEF